MIMKHLNVTVPQYHFPSFRCVSLENINTNNNTFSR